ncbi:uncharacterized protein LOC126318331 [Schistocerca gregaria]|uniref:uncharacterized protein LOC126318331 n=1 Tax=Schistocerca gregaria TaxID=7010 RepID=UPI00211E4E98|nr:uncharacterized protein LOC126318331 [Schistocerca gregaria]
MQQLPPWPLPPSHWVNAKDLTTPPIPPKNDELSLPVFERPLYQTYKSQLEFNEKLLAEMSLDLTVETDIRSFKRLNRMLLTEFLELVNVLIHKPAEWENNVNRIKFIIFNLHHLLNAYRPHECRETIISILEKQIERRTQLLDIQKKHLDSTEKKFEQIQTMLQSKLQKIECETIPTSEELMKLTGISLEDQPKPEKDACVQYVEHEVNTVLGEAEIVDQLFSYF